MGLGWTAEAAALKSALLYHVCVHSLAQRVLSRIRREELLGAGDRVGVAVSGGIDSVALLRLLLELRHELGIVLSVVHFNHKLRGSESDADQEFVADLARARDLEFHTDSDDVAVRAAEEHISVETAARQLRYGFFRSLLGSGENDGAALFSQPGTAAALSNSGAKAGDRDCVDRSAESAAPPQGQLPQRLKPESIRPLNGMAEAVPFPSAHPRFRVNVNKIATGHTLDDQAETVLMRLIRGTGLRGLGGIHPRIAVEDDANEVSGQIIRPLLGIRRRELEQYLTDIKQAWREDSTNAETKFTRNHVRQVVLPLLEQEFNPAVAESLAELAEIARGEEDYWENEVAGWLGTTVRWSRPDWAGSLDAPSAGFEPLVQIMSAQVAPVRAMQAHSTPTGASIQRRLDGPGSGGMNASVSRIWLLGEPTAVQRRLVKAVGDHAGIPLEFKHVEEVLRFAAEDGPSGKELALPLGWKLVREPESIVFLTPDLRRQEDIPGDYEYRLPVPGRAIVPEVGTVVEALRVGMEAGQAARPTGYNPEQLLDADSLPSILTVRNWRPGDRFRPAHTKSAKKIKELLQEHHIAQPARRLWPVIANGNVIVWVRGFPAPANLRAKPERDAVLIREIPVAEDPAT